MIAAGRVAQIATDDRDGHDARVVLEGLRVLDGPFRRATYAGSR